MLSDTQAVLMAAVKHENFDAKLIHFSALGCIQLSINAWYKSVFRRIMDISQSAKICITSVIRMNLAVGEHIFKSLSHTW